MKQKKGLAIKCTKQNVDLACFLVCRVTNVGYVKVISLIVKLLL